MSDIILYKQISRYYILKFMRTYLLKHNRNKSHKEYSEKLLKNTSG